MTLDIGNCYQKFIMNLFKNYDYFLCYNTDLSRTRFYKHNMLIK